MNKSGELLLEFINENFIDSEIETYKMYNNIIKLELLFEALVINDDDIDYIIENSDKIRELLNYFINNDCYKQFLNNKNLNRLFSIHLSKQSNKIKDSNEEINSLNLYFNDIRQFNLLTEDEEKELFDRVKNGDSLAREQIINSNLRLVISIANKFDKSKFPFSDIIQEGNIGLIYAVDNFDSLKECKFVTYAYYYIYYFILRAINDKSRIIKVPTRIVEKLNKIYSYINNYRKLNFNNPTLLELSDEFNTSMKEMEFLLSIQDPVHLEDLDEKESYIDEFAEDELFLKVYYSEINDILESDNHLSDREKLVLKYRYGFIDNDVYTLDQIGKILGISKERVRQIEMKALYKLKHNSRIPVIDEDFNIYRQLFYKKL